jgi:HlyD family secretion protein
LKWGRTIGWLVVLGAVTYAIYAGFTPRPILVDAEPVTRGLLRVTIQEEGRTRVIDRYVISAPAAGYARRLELKVGDPVRRGQVILRLDPLRSNVLDRRSREEAKARVAAVEAKLKSAQEAVVSATVDVRYWEAEFARIQALFDSGTIARNAYDQAQADQRRANAALRSAEFNVEVARHEIDASRTALQYSAAESSSPPAETVPVTPPVAGRVLKILHESEGAVSAGEPLLEVGNPKGLEIEVEVLSSDAVKISQGTRVLFERWGGAEPLEGRVRRIEPVAFTKISALGVEEQRVLVIVDFTTPAAVWERLGDLYRVEANFILWEAEDVLRVPASALFRRGEDWAVFGIREEAEKRFAELKIVKPGHRSGLTAEVLSGLNEGEMVITHPDDAISDGVPIQVRGQ